LTDHDALLRAICDHPDEDAPRLIFADWLDENAQPDRAAFIRTDIEMERRDPFDAERLRWELIEKPRLTASNSPLAAALPPLVSKSNWSQFGPYRRGFPTTVEVRDVRALPFLTTGDLAGLPVEILSVYWDRSQPFDVRWPRPLPALSLGGGDINRTEAAKFAASPLAAGLRELQLSGEPFRADAFRVLAASPFFRRLQALRIDSRVQARAEVDAVTNCPAGSLREFHLSSTGRPDFARLMAAPLLGNLETLNLNVGPAAGAGQALAAAETLKSVRSLFLYTPLGDAGLAAFLASPHLAGLRSLTNLTITRPRVEQLAATPTFANLRVLKLAGNSLGNGGATAIATSPHLAGLRVLDLAYTQTGDDGFRAILDSPLADGLVYFKANGSPASAEMKQAVREKFGDRVIL
jgi:uncharacterized protein (TIGR02996 family)